MDFWRLNSMRHIHPMYSLNDPIIYWRLVSVTLCSHAYWKHDREDLCYLIILWMCLLIEHFLSNTFHSDTSMPRTTVKIIDQLRLFCRTTPGKERQMPWRSIRRHCRDSGDKRKGSKIATAILDVINTLYESKS